MDAGLDTAIFSKGFGMGPSASLAALGEAGQRTTDNASPVRHAYARLAVSLTRKMLAAPAKPPARPDAPVRDTVRLMREGARGVSREPFSIDTVSEISAKYRRCSSDEPGVGPGNVEGKRYCTVPMTASGRE